MIDDPEVEEMLDPENGEPSITAPQDPVAVAEEATNSDLDEVLGLMNGTGPMDQDTAEVFGLMSGQPLDQRPFTLPDLGFDKLGDQRWTRQLEKDLAPTNFIKELVPGKEDAPWAGIVFSVEEYYDLLRAFNDHEKGQATADQQYSIALAQARSRNDGNFWTKSAGVLKGVATTGVEFFTGGLAAKGAGAGVRAGLRAAVGDAMVEQIRKSGQKMAEKSVAKFAMRATAATGKIGASGATIAGTQEVASRVLGAFGLAPDAGYWNSMAAARVLDEVQGLDHEEAAIALDELQGTLLSGMWDSSMKGFLETTLTNSLEQTGNLYGQIPGWNVIQGMEEFVIKKALGKTARKLNEPAMDYVRRVLNPAAISTASNEVAEELIQSMVVDAVFDFENDPFKNIPRTLEDVAALYFGMGAPTAAAALKARRDITLSAQRLERIAAMDDAAGYEEKELTEEELSAYRATGAVDPERAVNMAQKLAAGRDLTEDEKLLYQGARKQVDELLNDASVIPEPTADQIEAWSKATGAETAEVMPPSTLEQLAATNLARIFGQTLFIMKTKGGTAKGMRDPDSGALFLRDDLANPVAVAVHEIGHAVEAKLGPEEFNRVRAEIERAAPGFLKYAESAWQQEVAESGREVDAETLSREGRVEAFTFGSEIAASLITHAMTPEGREDMTWLAEREPGMFRTMVDALEEVLAKISGGLVTSLLGTRMQGIRDSIGANPGAAAAELSTVYVEAYRNTLGGAARAESEAGDSELGDLDTDAEGEEAMPEGITPTERRRARRERRRAQAPWTQPRGRRADQRYSLAARGLSQTLERESDVRERGSRRAERDAFQGAESDPRSPLEGEGSAATSAQIPDPSSVIGKGLTPLFSPLPANDTEKSGPGTYKNGTARYRNGKRQPGVLSSSRPTAVSAPHDPLDEHLVVSMKGVRTQGKKGHDLLEKMARWLRGSLFVRNPDKGDDAVIREAMRNAVSNLLALFDAVPQSIRDRSRLWYDGANVVAGKFADTYNVTKKQAAAAIAALSPQKNWYENVSLAERGLGILRDHQDARMDDAMREWARTEIYNANRKAYLPRLEEKVIEKIGDRSIKELIEAEQWRLAAAVLRAWDEVNNGREFHIWNPEGDRLEVARNADGSARKVSWGSYSEISKMVSVWANGTDANLDVALGDKHKVRSFYNNIMWPQGRWGDVTIDTHAVAAAMLLPLAGSSPEVKANLDGSGPGKTAIVGQIGIYPMLADVYRIAAEQRGVLPREMQSITWEAVRGLFTDTYKSNKANVEAIRNIWELWRQKKISTDEARARVLGEAGGISLPDWFPSGPAHVVTSFGGDVHRDGEGLVGGGDLAERAGYRGGLGVGEHVPGRGVVGAGESGDVAGQPRVSEGPLFSPRGDVGPDFLARFGRLTPDAVLNLNRQLSKELVRLGDKPAPLRADLAAEGGESSSAPSVARPEVAADDRNPDPPGDVGGASGQGASSGAAGAAETMADAPRDMAGGVEPGASTAAPGATQGQAALPSIVEPEPRDPNDRPRRMNQDGFGRPELGNPWESEQQQHIQDIVDNRMGIPEKQADAMLKNLAEKTIRDNYDAARYHIERRLEDGQVLRPAEQWGLLDLISRLWRESQRGDLNAHRDMLKLSQAYRDQGTAIGRLMSMRARRGRPRGASPKETAVQAFTALSPKERQIFSRLRRQAMSLPMKGRTGRAGSGIDTSSPVMRAMETSWMKKRRREGFTPGDPMSGQFSPMEDEGDGFGPVYNTEGQFRSVEQQAAITKAWDDMTKLSHDRTKKGTEAMRAVLVTQPGVRAAFGTTDPTSIPDEDMFAPTDEAYQLVSAYSKATASLQQRAIEFWLNSVLSGPKTQAVNITGNAVMTGLAGTVDKLSQAFMNNALAVVGAGPQTAQDAVNAREWAWWWRGFGGAFTDASQAWVRAMRYEVASLERSLEAQGVNLEHYAQKVENLDYGPKMGSYPMRVLRRFGTTALAAFDDFFKTLVYRAEAYSVAMRQAHGEGLRGELRHNRAEEILRDYSSDAHMQGVVAARRATFQEQERHAGRLTNKVVNLAQQGRDFLNDLTPGLPIPLGVVTIAFTRTPVNIYAAFLRKTPLQLVGMAIEAMPSQKTDYVGGYVGQRQKLVRDMSDALQGMALALVIASMVDDEDEEGRPFITGSSEPRAGKRQAQYRIAGGPNRIRIGSTYYDYGRIEPFGTAFASMVDMMHAFLDAEEDGLPTQVAAAAMEIGSSAARQAQDKTFLQGVSDLMNIGTGGYTGDATGRVHAAMDLVRSGYITPMVPNVIRQPLRESDSKMRVRRNLKDDPTLAWAVEGLYPVPGSRLDKALGAEPKMPRVDLWGREIDRPGTMGWKTDIPNRLLNPLRPTPAPSDRDVRPDILLRNYSQRANDNLVDGDEYFPTAPGRHFKMDKQEYRWTQEEYHTYLRDAGTAAYERVQALIDRGSISVTEPTDKHMLLIKKVISRERDKVRERLKRERKAQMRELERVE